MADTPTAHIFLSKFAEQELSFLKPHYLNNGCLVCLSVETQAPYLIAHLPPIPGFCEEKLTVHIPHNFVALIMEDAPTKQLGFLRNSA
jgi:hypothetical protein